MSSEHPDIDRVTWASRWRTRDISIFGIIVPLGISVLHVGQSHPSFIPVRCGCRGKTLGKKIVTIIGEGVKKDYSIFQS